MSCKKKRHEEANSRLSQCCERAYKWDKKIPNFFETWRCTCTPGTAPSVRTLVLQGIAVVRVDG